MSDITIIATCYGDYWDTFHEQWEASIAALDPAPARVILVSDVPREVPPGVDNIVIGPAHPLAALMRAQVDATSKPAGVTSPMPVIATRRRTVMQILRCQAQKTSWHLQ
jgi:hypothetical protein